MQKSLQILLIEDNENDVEVVERALENSTARCQLSVVHNGVEALNYLCKRGNFKNAAEPQLILSDINMPGMDGKKLLEAVKADPQLKLIPIVMLTSSRAPQDIKECYERHASCYVVKPFDCREYMGAIRQIATFWTSSVQYAR